MLASKLKVRQIGSMSHPEQYGACFLKLQMAYFGGNYAAGTCRILVERHVEYFPSDFKVSPVYAYLHSSLLNNSSSLSFLLFPSVLGFFFAGSNIFMLFLPFLFLAKGLPVSLIKRVAHIQKVFLLYIKPLHPFPPHLWMPVLDCASAAQSCFISPAPACCPTIKVLFALLFISLHCLLSV